MLLKSTGSSHFLQAPHVFHFHADEEKAARAMVKITKLPPGKAIGADDLQIWARRRNAGLSGVPDDRQQENLLHKQKRRRKKRKHWRKYPRKGLRVAQSTRAKSVRLNSIFGTQRTCTK
jgi:hypothetical protein